MSAATALGPIRNNRPLLLLILGVALGNLPMFITHLLNLWDQPQYQYFPIVLAIIGWLIYRSAEWRTAPLSGTWSLPFGVGLVAAALALGVAGTWVNSPWVTTLGLILAFGGVLLILRRWLYLENPLGIWALSLLVLRPPLGLDKKLALWLQGVTARVSGSILDILGVVNLVEGNTIVLEKRHLFVEQACSGIVSLMSIIACCAIIAVWQNRPAPHALLLTASGAVWAGILNIFRITIMATALDFADIDMTEGWSHEALGLVLFACTLGLTFCTDRLLLFMMTPIASAEAELYGNYASEHTEPILNRIFNFAVEPKRLFFRMDEDGKFASDQPTQAPRPSVPAWTIGLAVLFLAVGLTQIVRAATASGDRFARVEPIDAIQNLNSASMPADFGGQKLAGFETVKRKVRDRFGEQSHQWAYDANGVKVLYSIDFVFGDWHDLTVCYEGLGWQSTERVVHTDPQTGRKFIQVRFSKGDERALLVFGDFDRTGKHVDPPETSLIGSLTNRVQGVPGGVYQTQTFVVIQKELPDRIVNEISKRFVEFHDRMSGFARGN